MIKSLHANFDTARNALTFAADSFAPEFCENADFWRMHLDYCENGKNRELGVYSHAQIPASVSAEDGAITVAYDRITAENGVTFDISVLCIIREIDGEIDLSMKINNRSALRINELQYPVAEFTRIGGELANDILYAPSGLGLRVPNPLKAVQKNHTEYKAADYKNSWYFLKYPGQLTMPWFGIQSGEHYLSMARRDAEACRLSTFCLATGRREDPIPRIIMAVSSYPAVIPGEEMTLEHYRISVSDKDWRDVADSYRKWSNETWLAPRVDENGKITLKESIRHMHGWQRIILKHQYGEVFHTYADLPRIYEEGARFGIKMILLFGWWQEGMDNGYPRYLPDDELGGAEGLRRAIREINEKGGQVVLYANGQLIDTDTEFYKSEGYKYTKKNIEKSEYREFYRFSNNGSLLRISGLKTFSMGCFGTEGWRNKVLEIKNRHLDLGSNGTFFDQFSCCFYLCFDESHSHGHRIDLDPQLRVELIREISESLGEDEWFGSEWVLDRISPLLDFSHGCGTGMVFAENAYPRMFRYAFPEIMVSNRFLHDEKNGYRRELNYAFIHGMLFDVSLYRGRIDSINDCSDYAEWVGKLISLREKYCDFFVDGRYDIPSIELPEGIKAAEYKLDGRRILAVWNDTDAEFVYGAHPPVASGDVAIIELS